MNMSYKLPNGMRISMNANGRQSYSIPLGKGKRINVSANGKKTLVMSQNGVTIRTPLPN